MSRSGHAPWMGEVEEADDVLGMGWGISLLRVDGRVLVAHAGTLARFGGAVLRVEGDLVGRGGGDVHAPDVAEAVGSVVLLGQGSPDPEEPQYGELKHIRA